MTRLLVSVTLQGITANPSHVFAVRSVQRFFFICSAATAVVGDKKPEREPKRLNFEYGFEAYVAYRAASSVVAPQLARGSHKKASTKA